MKTGDKNSAKFRRVPDGLTINPTGTIRINGSEIWGDFPRVTTDGDKPVCIELVPELIFPGPTPSEFRYKGELGGVLLVPAEIWKFKETNVEARK